MSKIIVIGDVMLDQLIEGSISRISPEAPAPVLDIAKVAESPGGAANVAANIGYLGQKVRLLGVTGDDATGDRLRWLLNACHNLDYQLLKVAGHATTMKARACCGGQQILRMDSGTRPYTEELLGAALCTLNAGDVALLVFSDYDKGALSPDMIGAIKEAARAKGIPIFADAKPHRLRLYSGVSLVTPNAVEITKYGQDYLLHPGVTDPNEVIETAAKGLIFGQQILTVVVTRGQDGASVYTPANQNQLRIEHYPPARPVSVFDPTGAGDTFLAAAAVCQVEQVPLDEAVQRCNVAAGIAVGRRSTVVVTRDEWEDAILEQEGPAAKRMSPAQVVAFAQRAARRHQKVVFTNGVFDLLHAGHMWLLEQARDQGDILIVAINSDVSVKRLKGPDRPIISDSWRSRALLAYADAVVVFDSDTPLELIKAIRPAVLVKGAEYAGKLIPGDDYVIGHGGLVHLVPMLPGYSTTAIITCDQQPSLPSSTT